MKKLLTILLLPLLGYGQFVFTKNANTDPSLEENQDRISDKVWLTRGNQYGIYNAYDQTSAKNQATSGIELALGNFEQLSQLNFETISEWGKKFKGDWLNKNLVLKLTETDEYYSFVMTSWENRGGFSYTRSSTALSIMDYSNTITIYPNPTTSILIIEGDLEYDIEVYDLLGNRVLETQGNSINMEHLSTATYIVKATDKSNNEELTYKVVKN
ncbi:MAG: T9SS type A sorting domain-containing protein [Flavobacteriaceae bacterium]